MPGKATRQRAARLSLKVDGVSYDSRTLYDFHVMCKEALDRKLIESFEVPNGLGKKSRYGSYKPVVNGIKFDSIMEAQYYIYLLGEKSGGGVRDFDRQVIYELQPRFYKNGKTFRPISYIADFVVTNNDGTVDVIDIKGKETVEFKIKRKLFEYEYEDLHLRTVQYYPDTCEWLDTEAIRKLKRKKKPSNCTKKKK